MTDEADRFKTLFNGRTIVITTVLRTKDTVRAGDLIGQACCGPKLRMCFGLAVPDEEISQTHKNLLLDTCPHDHDHPTVQIVSFINTDEDQISIAERVNKILKLHVCSSLVEVKVLEGAEGESVWDIMRDKLKEKVT